MKNTIKLVLAAGLALGMSMVSHAANITFTQQGFLQETNLRTNGTLIAALNFGTILDATLNGITFVGNDGFVTAGDVSISVFGNDFIAINADVYNGTTVTGLNAETLLGPFGYSYNPVQGDGSVRFSGLTNGQTYQVQLLIVDDRGGGVPPRVIDIFSGDSNTGTPGIYHVDYTSRPDHSALSGTFTASSTDQALFIQLVGFPQDAGMLNGMQFRAIPADTAPPVVSTLNPPDDGTAVPVDANLVVTFNENVAPGATNNILIKKSSDDSVVATLAVSVSSSNVTFSGNTMTIDLPSDLAARTGFYVQVPAGVITDGSGNPFPGITDKTTWNFVTGQPRIDFTQHGFLHETDLSTNGTLIAALNFGTTLDATLNGITFVGNDGFATAGDVSISIFGNDFIGVNADVYNGTTVTGPDAETLLGPFGISYNPVPNPSGGSVDFSGLTVGKTYEIQFLFVDDRQNQIQNRTMDIFNGDSNVGIPVISQADFTSRADQSALLVTGTFTADATTNSVCMQLHGFPNDPGHLNGMQFRLVPARSDVVRVQSAAANNFLVLEAEHYNQNTPVGGQSWVFTGAPPTLQPSDTNTVYSGTGVMFADPNTGVNVGSPGLGTTPTATPHLQFKVQFVATGTHYAWVRGIGDSGTGNPSANDSVLVGLDGLLTDRFTGFPLGQGYSWGNTPVGDSPITMNVPTAGVHVIDVWMREDGFVFDKLLLTTTSGYTPTGVGPAESSVAPVGGTTLKITRSGIGNLTLEWTGGGILQSSTNAAGTYGDIVGSSSPWPVVPAGGQMFYRVKQ